MFASITNEINVSLSFQKSTSKEDRPNGAHNQRVTTRGREEGRSVQEKESEGSALIFGGYEGDVMACIAHSSWPFCPLFLDHLLSLARGHILFAWTMEQREHRPWYVMVAGMSALLACSKCIGPHSRPKVSCLCQHEEKNNQEMKFGGSPIRSHRQIFLEWHSKCFISHYSTFSFCYF